MILFPEEQNILSLLVQEGSSSPPSFAYYLLAAGEKDMDYLLVNLIR